MTAPFRSMLLLLAALVACRRSAPPKPLPEAILGEWERLCATDQESSSSCLGKDDAGLTVRFVPDGTIVAGARSGAEMEGTWTLRGDELHVVYEDGGSRLDEVSRARIAGGRLVLWYPSQGFGAVYGRVGAPFVPAPSETSSGGAIAHEIGGVHYRITLPGGYRLSRDDNDRQAWSPSSGDGFVVELSVSPRSQVEVGGAWTTPPCDDRDQGVSGSRETIDGVERETSVGLSYCLADSPRSLSCSTGHTRGYLEDAEHDAALALCRSLTLE